MESNACRLCSSCENDHLMNIFSGIGMELKMAEIIHEHFKSDISEADPLPNVVCRMCWSTTETFHELYEKSKSVQRKFLDALVKTEIESDPIDVWPIDMKGIHEESCFVEEPDLHVEPVKIEESGSEDEGSEDDRPMNYEENSDDESVDGDAEKNSKSETSLVPPKSVRTSRRWRKKQKDAQFQEFFDKYKHFLDLKCDLCPKIFISLNDARAHYSDDHNISKGFIKCCGLKLFFRNRIVEHLNRHLDPDKYKCPHCDKVLCSDVVFKRHVKRMHTDVRVRKSGTRHKEKVKSEEETKFIAENFDMKCDQYDAVFTSLYDAQLHYKDIHNEPKGYVKCCGTKLKENWLVRDHVKFHLNPESFKCDMCGKSYTSRMILVQHKRRHRLTMNKSFICDFCGKKCRCKESITRHIFSNHVKSEPKYECDICHKKFQLPSLLKNHHYSVHREKKRSITCEICGKSFHIKFHLDKHMLSHTDKSERLAQRQQCEHCGEWLMTKSGVYYHKQIHTTGVQKCSQCDMELPNKLALLGHIRTHHREHKFKCSFCGKTFATGSVLKKHEEFHTRHNVYPCKFCPKTFTVSPSLQTHTRRNHYEEYKLYKEAKKINESMV